MEQKLAEYRARRRRQEFVENVKDKITGTPRYIMSLVLGSNGELETDTRDEDQGEMPLLPPPPPYSLNNAESEQPALNEPLTSQQRTLLRGNLVVLSLLWLALLFVSLQLGLALAYLLVSALIFIYLSTSTRPRAPGEPSAYSVFNPNCESIDGTLTAEQFEREIRFGPGNVR